MLNTLFAFLFMLASFITFAAAYQTNGINRTVINIPLNYFEVAVPIVNKDQLFFDRNVLESGVKNYFKTSLFKYTKDYNVAFYYYNVDDKSYCVNDNCKGVDVIVNAKLAFNINYSRTMFYEIRERKNG